MKRLIGWLTEHWPKGSTWHMFAMYALWIWYICAQLWCYGMYQTWLPESMTYTTAACFIVETVSLMRIRMAKEGAILPKRRENKFLSKLGISNDSELEEVAQEISDKNKEESNVESQAETIQP